MKALCLILLTVFVLTNSYSQQLESWGAGVVDFLLTNPKTANKTNATEAAALNVIGNLLNQSAQRKHELNVARSGRNEIVINTNSGNQASVYLDDKGNVYLLYDGIIHQIAAVLVDQAKSESVKPTMINDRPSIRNASLPDYNLPELKDEFKFEKRVYSDYQRKMEKYFMSSNKETLSTIASKFSISRDDIYFEAYKLIDGEPLVIGARSTITGYINPNPNEDLRLKQNLQQIYDSQKPLVQTPYGCSNSGDDFFTNEGSIHFYVKKLNRMVKPDGFFIYLNKITNDTQKEFFDFMIVTSFTCNWVRDFDGLGLDFEDFQGIKRSFTKDESILFVLGYTSETDSQWSLDIYEASTGKTLFTESGISEKGGNIITTKKNDETLPFGVYIYNFILKAEGTNPLSKTGKFEIIPDL